MPQFNMNLTQVETYLNELKGEQSVSGLYQTGKQDVIRDFRELFLGTKLTDVSNLDRYISDVGKRGSSKTIAIEGQKGVGKSTLLSTLLLYHYLHGNIDAIKYLRYNSTDKNFEEILHIGKDEPQNSVIVADDVHYFYPDLLTGRVAPFTRLFENLIKDYADAKRTLFVYVSDSTPIDSLQYLYDGIFRIGRRDDLPGKMPWVRDIWKMKNSGVVKVDREFYGKTYSLLQGDVDLYDIANLFGEMISEDTGLLATNPRLLRPIIKKLSGEHIPKKLTSENELAKSMLRSADVDKQLVHSYFHRELEGKNANLDSIIEWKGVPYAVENMRRRFERFRGSLPVLSQDALKKAVVDFRSSKNRFNDDISPLQNIQSRLDVHQTWLERMTQNYRFYSGISSESLIRYKEAYIRTRDAASNFASQNPSMFTVDKNVAELLADPKKALSTIIQKRVEQNIPV